MNESFWDAQNVEIEACAIFCIFPGPENLPPRKQIEDSMLWVEGYPQLCGVTVGCFRPVFLMLGAHIQKVARASESQWKPHRGTHKREPETPKMLMRTTDGHLSLKVIRIAIHTFRGKMAKYDEMTTFRTLYRSL